MSDEDKTEVRIILSLVEHLAIGTETGIYDLDLVNRMSGAFFVGMYAKFKPYIESARTSNPNNYCEFESLRDSIQAKRKLATDHDKLKV